MSLPTSGRPRPQSLAPLEERSSTKTDLDPWRDVAAPRRVTDWRADPRRPPGPSTRFPKLDTVRTPRCHHANESKLRRNIRRFNVPAVPCPIVDQWHQGSTMKIEWRVRGTSWRDPGEHPLKSKNNSVGLPRLSSRKLSSSQVMPAPPGVLLTDPRPTAARARDH